MLVNQRTLPGKIDTSRIKLNGTGFALQTSCKPADENIESEVFMFPSDLRHMKPEDEVAVMPRGGNYPHAVLKIARVRHVGGALIHTQDGGMFAAADGGDYNLGQTLYIEPATEDHRRALRWKHAMARY